MSYYINFFFNLSFNVLKALICPTTLDVNARLDLLSKHMLHTVDSLQEIQQNLDSISILMDEITTIVHTNPELACLSATLAAANFSSEIAVQSVIQTKAHVNDTLVLAKNISNMSIILDFHLQDSSLNLETNNNIQLYYLAGVPCVFFLISLIK